LVTEPATPLTNGSVAYRSCDGRPELVASSREELGAVVKAGVADATGCQAAADAPTLVNDAHLTACVGQSSSGAEPCDTAAQDDRVGHQRSVREVTVALASHAVTFDDVARVLVTEKIADDGLELLRAAGHEVDVQTGLDEAGLISAIAGAEAIIIRSATTVTAELLAAGSDLKIVGRAGIGLDNVDVNAATEHGVLVANAPFSNAVTTAEHTMAMLLAQARNIAHAHAALVNGRWERSSWGGVELAEKTLGIIGLGRIGGLVAARAKAFDMNLVAYDPFIAPERAAEIGAELVDLETLMATSDFVTLHLARTPETMNLVNADVLAKAKPGQRIVNVARGGLIDEVALADAIANGPVGGAAIDVFATEPTTESPLFSLPQVTVTPHLGASTAEAQLKAGVQVAEQVALGLAGETVPFAVNAD